jgi:hypothetical protein
MWSKSNKHAKHHDSSANVGSPKPGFLDRAVGKIKQVAGRAFDEPDLYYKGQKQEKYGSRVTVNEAPETAHRPWVTPQGNPAVPVHNANVPHQVVLNPPAQQESHVSQPHVSQPHVASAIVPPPKAVVTEVTAAPSSVPGGFASPFEQPTVATASPIAQPVIAQPVPETAPTRHRWF